MGNNNKHFGGSREQRKNFRDQGNMSWKHFWEQGVLLMGNKGSNPKRLRDQGNTHPLWEGLINEWEYLLLFMKMKKANIIV